MQQISGHCDCGSITITIPGTPRRMTDCPCDFCQRTGVRWAYVPKDSVVVTGTTDSYMRGARRLAFHRCASCGVLTHWTAVTVDWKNVGVNMRNFDPAFLVNIPIGPPQ